MCKKSISISILILILIFSLFTGCKASIDNIIEKNTEKLTKDNPYLRKQAVASLGSTGDERVILPIAKMLCDSDKGVVDQSYIELNKLREFGLLVDELILKACETFSNKERKAITKYLIIAHQNGIDLQPTLLKVLPGIDNIESYAELIVFLNSRVDSNLYATLLAELSGQNGAVAAEALLLLDKYGYLPPKALIDELVKQGSSISEATGQLLVQFACRKSYTNVNNQNEQLQIYYRDGEININDRSENSKIRCEIGDTLYQKIPSDLNYISRLALLRNEQDTTQELTDLFNMFVNIDHINVSRALINDKESLINNDPVKLQIIETLATNQTISQWVSSNLKPLDVTAVISDTENNENNDEENEEGNNEEHNNQEEIDLKDILIIDSEEGNIITKYHWYLPENYRPEKQEDVRFVISVPKGEGLLSIVDIYNKKIVLKKEIDPTTDIYTIIDDFIKMLDDN